MHRWIPVCLIVFISTGLWADEQTFWAKKAQNPLSDLIKYPIIARFDFGYGHKDAVNSTTSLRPSMVADVSKHWNLVNRLDLSFKYQPGRTLGEKDSFGMGDTTYEGFFTPSNDWKIDWGIGPAFQIPTATDPQLGTRKWSAGAATAVNTEAGPFVFGLRARHLWSFAGKDDRPDVNRTAVEYWLYANLGNGWWIGTSPVNMADWETSSEDRWTVPLGGGFGKVVRQRIPINLKLEAYSFAELPNDLADWSVMFSLEYLLPENALFKR